MAGLTRKMRELADGLERLKARHGYFVLQCSFSDVAILVAHLQFALRHPANIGYSAKEGTRIVNDIIDSLGKHEPRVAELLREGFDPTHDVPRTPA